jgi:chromate reductase, NAD(P)H dehydrogenase (quinone)
MVMSVMSVMSVVKVIALSGSLRASSKNTTVLRAAATLAPAGVEIVLFSGLGELPHFSPDLDDLDHGIAPAAVLELRRQLRAADAVIICSPEYAHGVAGVMKNALDWMVGSGEFVGKPTMVLNLAPGSVHAHAAICETLRTMDGQVHEAILPAPLGGSAISERDIVEHPGRAAFVRDALATLLHAIDLARSQPE